MGSFDNKDLAAVGVAAAAAIAAVLYNLHILGELISKQ